ncbi:HPr kinase/phosphorylase [Falsiroseomonas tokyonensis]|uniref:HPr kinase/phosphorylase n=1 Tax=Falsiroseomonas tokyonensis TaxID=430521 RepID=A0ABV7BQZ7_9PROT|nr:HPr kinase/phosphatase C-terminal domain-containing protein [Falsiroseomonas tokyonensis]MBU8537089.1 HPr kinase/phosphatase C-terminal domain-containing protein [Falsiroseomonas tokyonensis]
MSLHGSCVALDEQGVLILGPSGSGKSDLVLRLLGRGWDLVADDQVEVAAADGALLAEAPAPLRGMLEIRGLGLMQDLPSKGPVRLRLVARLLPEGAPMPRLPAPASYEALGLSLPMVALHGLRASAPDRLGFALAAACGRARMAAGAFETGDALA